MAAAIIAFESPSAANGIAVSALMFDKALISAGRREEHQCSVTHHAAGQDDRLAGEWAVVARIDLETEIPPPKSRCSEPSAVVIL